MRVLIAGAGVAGLTLAYWLEKNGHKPVIIEKSETIRTEGYMLDFTGTGWDVADRMGIIPELRKRAYPAENIVYKDENDKISAQISVHDLLSATGNEVNFAALNRRDLVLTLYEAVQDKVEICFSKTIDTIQQDDNSVKVTFSDDSQGEYDILVGCDGIHSKTRQLVFGDESQFTQHLGYQFAIFEVAPLKKDLQNSYHMHVEPDFQLGVYPTKADKWMIFSAFKVENNDIPTQSERVQAIKQRISHLKWYVPEILDSFHEGDYVFQDNITQIQMPCWYDRRVALIGDAAYCPTLVSGQGASMAMAGAYFLAESLQENDKPEKAFQMMDVRLRPHIEKIQQSARSFASTFIPKSRFRIAMTYLALKLSNISMFKSLIGKQFTVNSIL